MSALQTKLSSRSVSVFCKRLLSLERKGRHEKALSEISESWADPSFLPGTTGLSETDAAELLLRFAALLTYHGHNVQIANSQHRAMDILTAARRMFLDADDRDKSAECESYIALCYWRTGEINEAAVWVESALERVPVPSETRLHAIATRTLIRLAQKRYAENIDGCESTAQLFFGNNNPFLTGTYCTNIAVSFKNVGRLDEALRYLELARDNCRLSGHRVYLGVVENNLAQLYRAMGRFSRAHASIDSAIHAFRLARDRTREGFAHDTKALIYLEEEEYVLGLKAVDTALKMLYPSENAAYIADTLQTKSKLLLFVNDIAGAVSTLHEAVEISSVNIGQDAASAILDEFRLAANKRAGGFTPPHEPASEQENLQLLLPPSLSRYKEYQGLWINNSHLENVGLIKGSLALIVQDEIKRGDLVAIVEIETDLVNCGFYDEDFGIVCLEGVNIDPRLFDADAVRILGKIVGACSDKRDQNGKLIVEPLHY